MLKPVLSLLLSALLLAPALPAETGKKPKNPSSSTSRSTLSARVAPEYQTQLRATPLAVRAQARALQISIHEHSPALRALREQAEAARTSEEKRNAWNEHNRLLYGEMRRRAPGLKSHIDLLEKIARSRFEHGAKRGESIDSYGFDRAEN